MYVIGFVSAWALARTRIQRPDIALTTEQLENFLFYAALGVLLGGRIGYMVFYNLPTLIHAPLTLFKVWDGGMSFHVAYSALSSLSIPLDEDSSETFFASRISPHP